MSTKKRVELEYEMNIAGQRSGNINVLLTNAIAQKIGLSATEFECMSLLQDTGPLPAGELARRCGITTGGLTGLVDRLEKLGYVKRSSDPTDRRRVIISASLNKKAIKKITDLYEPLACAFSAMSCEYSEEELEFLVAHTKKINIIFERLLLEFSAK